MSKQEKINSELVKTLERFYGKCDVDPIGVASVILQDISLQGVVIKVDKELPETLYHERAHLDPKWVEEAVKSDMLKWHNDSLEPLIKEVMLEN